MFCISNPTNGGKDRKREKKAHEGGTPHRLSYSLQRSCSVEKLLRSTITLKKKRNNSNNSQSEDREEGKKGGQEPIKWAAGEGDWGERTFLPPLPF